MSRTRHVRPSISWIVQRLLQQMGPLFNQYLSMHWRLMKCSVTIVSQKLAIQKATESRVQVHEEARKVNTITRMSRLHSLIHPFVLLASWGLAENHYIFMPIDEPRVKTQNFLTSSNLRVSSCHPRSIQGRWNSGWLHGEPFPGKRWTKHTSQCTPSTNQIHKSQFTPPV